MQLVVLKNATDNRLIVFAGIEYVERSAFMVLVAHNGCEIIDELVFPNDLGALYIFRKVTELAEKYGKYSDLVELETNDRELIRLAANTAGVLIRPKRKNDTEPLTKRALQKYAEDGVIYELYDIKPLVEPSKLRKWIIHVLSRLLNKLQGERR